MKRPTAKKLQLTKETLRTLSSVDLQGVIGGTDPVPLSADGTNCVETEISTTCADSSDGCAIDLNPNVLIGGNTARRF